MAHFVEWDSFDLRVDGDKLNIMVKSIIGKSEPIERIDVRFLNGVMRVEGAIRKFISVPFSADVTGAANAIPCAVPLKFWTAGRG